MAHLVNIPGCNHLLGFLDTVRMLTLGKEVVLMHANILDMVDWLPLGHSDVEKVPPVEVIFYAVTNSSTRWNTGKCQKSPDSKFHMAINMYTVDTWQNNALGKHGVANRCSTYNWLALPPSGVISFCHADWCLSIVAGPHTLFCTPDRCQTALWGSFRGDILYHQV